MDERCLGEVKRPGKAPLLYLRCGLVLAVTYLLFNCAEFPGGFLEYSSAEDKRGGN